MFTSKYVLALTTLAAFALASVVPAPASTSASTSTSAQSFVYTFDPKSAAGVKGHVRVDYSPDSATTADVSADLDFGGINLAAVKMADGNCTTEPTEYKWHIHVKWSSPKSSDSFAMCSKAATGNHYDPLHACGPNSEFAETPQCLPKIASYACSPANYASNPLVCEKGDLSGKFGGFKLDANKKVHGKWTDVHYPTVGENTPQWNIILHAVCGKNTPRIACALGKRVDMKGGKYYSDNNGNNGNDGGKPVAPLTPYPKIAKPYSASHVRISIHED